MDCKMALRFLSSLVLLLGCVCAAPVNEAIETEKVAPAPQKQDLDKDDLKTAASSSYYGGYPAGYSGHGITGHGIVDDRYNSYYSGVGGYDNTYGYNGYSGAYPGYSGSNVGYSGYKGYRGYGSSGFGGNGGYGGYGGNGGLSSYDGYYNPYQGGYHLGYGYYNKRPGYGGNIYNTGVTPSLVTGYRGYSRK